MPAREETPLKRLMESEGRSQAWLARRLGVKRQQVGTWIHGIHVPKEATRLEIARMLCAHPDEPARVHAFARELWPEAEAEQVDQKVAA